MESPYLEGAAGPPAGPECEALVAAVAAADRRRSGRDGGRARLGGAGRPARCRRTRRAGRPSPSRTQSRRRTATVKVLPDQTARFEFRREDREAYRAGDGLVLTLAAGPGPAATGAPGGAAGRVHLAVASPTTGDDTFSLAISNWRSSAPARTSRSRSTSRDAYPGQPTNELCQRRAPDLGRRASGRRRPPSCSRPSRWSTSSPRRPCFRDGRPAGCDGLERERRPGAVFGLAPRPAGCRAPPPPAEIAAALRRRQPDARADGGRWRPNISRGRGAGAPYEFGGAPGRRPPRSPPAATAGRSRP